MDSEVVKVKTDYLLENCKIFYWCVSPSRYYYAGQSDILISIITIIVDWFTNYNSNQCIARYPSVIFVFGFHLCCVCMMQLILQSEIILFPESKSHYISIHVADMWWKYPLLLLGGQTTNRDKLRHWEWEPIWHSWIFSTSLHNVCQLIFALLSLLALESE